MLFERGKFWIGLTFHPGILKQPLIVFKAFSRMMSDLFLKSRPEISSRFSAEGKVVLLAGDCLDTLKSLPSGIARLVVSSPPYNIGKEYETETALTEYLESMKPVLREIWRVIAQDGSLCWQVGNYVINGEIVPLDIPYYSLFRKLGFKLRNRIIWHFDHGLHASRRFSGRYETLNWFTKSDSYVFNLDTVRIPSKYPGKTHFKGPKRGLPSGNPLGKNPSDYWTIVEQDWEREIWEIPNVKANHPEKTIHPCQFPVELVQRCVLALTNEGDFVLDPFAGAGTVGIAALLHNRRCILCEREPEYVQLTQSRFQDFFAGILKVRPLGKPVHQPSGREKVSQIPSAWESSSEVKLF